MTGTTTKHVEITAQKFKKTDKTNYLNNIYKDLETETNTAKLFGKTRELLGQVKAGPPTCFFSQGKTNQKAARIG